jgi:hypothetical protein
MKAVKLSLIFAVAALMTLGLGSAAFAFHSGGVAHCDGCHTMHNSRDGVYATEHEHGAGGSPGATVTPSLMIGTDASSTCLNCHNGTGSYHVLSADGSVYSPGGDFFWVTLDTPGPRGSTFLGEGRGHNVVSADFGLVADGTLTVAPNRDAAVPYQASVLGCQSCHDPHGKNASGLPITGSGSYGAVATSGTAVGNYRLLGTNGYDAGSGVTFTNPAPIAMTNSYGESDSSHVDYGTGMSEWCVNCHSGFDADGSLAHRHPASNDAHLDGFGDVYNRYRATGNVLPAPDSSDSYDRLVPFERGTADVTLLDNTTTMGPDINSNIMCLTCHRAHASAFPDITRWDMTDEILADSSIYAAYGAVAYYGDDIETRYGTYQRSLCNKCHVQD